jgi:tetratricopeptide (TPR) repeat protein
VRAAYETHLATCMTCQRALDEAREVQGLLRSLGQTGVSPEARSRLVAMFRQAAGETQPTAEPRADPGSLASPAAPLGGVGQKGNLGPVEPPPDLSLPREDDPTRATLAACEALLDRCFHQLFNDPRDALALADSAVALSAELPAERYGAALVHDLRGRCLGYLANARRVCDDLRGAEETFAEAEQQLQHGTGDPLEKARLSWFEGHLRATQRRFVEAHHCYDEAVALYRRVGDKHLEGRALGDKATAFSNAGEFEAAIRLRQEALALLDPEREPRMWTAAQHNLAHDLSQSGRAAEALEMLEPLRRQWERLGDVMNLVRFRWLQGKVFAGLGRYAEAEAAYLDTRSGVLAKALVYDGALVSLELAMVYAAQNRTADMKRLAAEMLPIFQSLGIHREAMAAVLVFQQAAEMEAVSIGLIQELAAYFQRASKEPGLRFRGSV